MPVTDRTKRALQNSLADKLVADEIITKLDTPAALSDRANRVLRSWTGDKSDASLLSTIVGIGLGIQILPALQRTARDAMADRTAAAEVITLLSS